MKTTHVFKTTERHRRGLTDYVLTCSCGKLNGLYEYRSSADRAGRRHIATSEKCPHGARWEACLEEHPGRVER